MKKAVQMKDFIDETITDSQSEETLQWLKGYVFGVYDLEGIDEDEKDELWAYVDKFSQYSQPE